MITTAYWCKQTCSVLIVHSLMITAIAIKCMQSQL